MFARRYGLVAVILLRHVVHLILHIGPHKTGSSYLQRRFYKDHDILMENGVLYPINDWIGGGHGHAYLVDKKQLSSIGDELNRIAKDKPSLKSVVISTENFDRLSRDDIKILRDKITIPTTVVYYLRRMDKTLFANWQEDVKFGSLETFSRFLLRHFAFPIESKIVNHSVVVDLWADVFGKSAISIVDYDDLVGTDTDIYCHFVETFCGINDVATPSNAREKWLIPLSQVHLHIGPGLARRVGSAAYKKSQAGQADPFWATSLEQKRCTAAFSREGLFEHSKRSHTDIGGSALPLMPLSIPHLGVPGTTG